MDELAQAYQLLGITPPVREEQVKQAYRDLVKVWHPDRFGHDERLRLKAQDKLKEINGAYQMVLASLFAQGTTPEPPPAAEPDSYPESPSQATEASEASSVAPGHRARWMALGAIVPLLLVGTVWWIYGKKDRTEKNPVLPSPPPLKAEVATVGWRRGLILEFKFDHEPAGGLIPDLSNHGNNGQASGVKWVAEGRHGGAVEFGPGESSIRVANKPGLDPSQLTLAVWIKTTRKDPIWRRIFDKGTWSNGTAEEGYDMTMGGDDTSTSTSWEGKALWELSARASYSHGDLADGAWHQLAGVYDGKDFLLYVDGQPENKNHVTHPLEPTPYDLTIGHTCTNSASEANTEGFIGMMDDIMVFDRPLTEGEILELIQSQDGSR